MSTRSGRKTKNEVCVLCTKAIIEGKDEALMCKGDICANGWMHRYCAGMPTTHYKVLEKSPAPFNCYLCSQQKQTATIEKMRSTIASLTAEVVELRAALESQKATGSTQTTTSLRSGSQTGNGRSWSEVVRRGNQANTHTSRRPPRRTQASNRQNSSNNSRKNNENQTKKAPSNWIKVDGARKIWGTLNLVLPPA